MAFSQDTVGAPVNWTAAGTYTISVTCSAGDLIFVFATVAPSLSGETFTLGATLNTSWKVYYCQASSAHSSSNISFSPTGGPPVFGGAAAVAWSGGNGTVTFGTVNSGSGGTPSTITCTVTPATAGSEVLGFILSDGSAFTAGTGVTVDENIALPGAPFYLNIAHANATQSSSYTLSGTQANPPGWWAVAVALEPNTVKSASEAATGAEALDVELKPTDSATGNQSIGLTATVTKSEAAAGVETPSLSTKESVSEHAMGAEVASSPMGTAAAAPDGSHGQETVSVQATEPVAQSATGHDNAHLPTFDASVADSGHGHETETARIAPQEAAHGVDAPTETAHVSAADAAHGTEADKAGLKVAATDTAADVDAAVHTETIAQPADAATGAQSVTASPGDQQDAATGAETVSVQRDTVRVADSAVGAEEATAVVHPSGVSDAATGTEHAAIAGVKVTDTAHGAQAVGPPTGTGSTFQELGDQAAGAESVSAKPTISVADSAHGAEVDMGSTLGTPHVTEHATGADAATVRLTATIPYVVIWD